MSQGPLCPNLTQKFQKEVSQIANRNFSCVILLGGLSVNLNHLKMEHLQNKYSAATKVLLKAKKELMAVNVKKEKTQKITAVIQSGTLRPALIAQKAREKSNRRVQVHCQFCDEVSESRRKYILHRKDKHPDELFYCKVCSRGYQSFNGCYIHEKSHAEFSIFCPVCGKGFNYQNDCDRHYPVHDEQLKVYCAECGKGFACKASLTRHSIVHDNLVLYCDNCDKSYNSELKLKRHWRGVHGEGFQSHCGEFNFKSPGPRYNHEKNCTPCKALKEQEKQNKKVKTKSETSK